MRWALVIAGFLIPTNNVTAHGLVAEIRFVRDNLLVKVCYDDGSPVAGAQVRFHVFHQANGVTNELGLVLMGMPAETKIPISVDAGGGHVLKFTVSIPPKPWQENQLFTPAIEELTASPRRFTELLVGVVAITLVAFALAKVLPRRHQPS